jgi:hypothetical protein
MVTVGKDNRFTAHDIVLRGTDGKKRTFLCLPVYQLQGWLFTINPNKVGAEYRDACKEIKGKH